MKVFISWSGERSRMVALALRDWLPNVIQSIVPWMSEQDIEAGVRWNNDIAKELSATKFGIICVTPENQQAPWILFEAGALAKTLENTSVCPYLIGMTPSQLEAGPLTQFQAKQANEIQTWELVRTINRALVDSMLLEDRLRNIFDRWWSDLDATLKNLPESQTNQEIERPLPDMIKEILGLVRNLSRPTREADTFTISLVNYLSPKEERMIRMLFGLGEERRYSFEEIGQVFGISSKSVDNQIRAAFAKLRSMAASLYEREQQKP